ncbi:hypothetical protein Lser_V15G19590 [Lactuca serriola]
MAEQKVGLGEMRNKKIRISTDAEENFPGINASDDNGNVIGGEQVQGLATDEDAQMISIETEKKVYPFIGNGRYAHFGQTYSHDFHRRAAASYPICDGFSQFRPPNLFNVAEDYENQEFGRDPNRLDYFRVMPFDVFGDDHLTGIVGYGGGVGGRLDRGLVEGLIGSDTAVAGGGIRLRVPVGISANNGTEAVLERVNQEKGNGVDGGGGGRRVVGPRLEKERGSSETAGVGGGDGGEGVVERLLGLKKDGATVTVRVAVIVVMLLMMVMVMVMMVLVLVMGKMEVKG